MSKKQLSFSVTPPTSLVHGGDLAKGVRKCQRPLKMNRPLHVVLRAKRSGLIAKERKIRQIIIRYGVRFGVKIYRSSVNSNHIHLLIVTPHRKNFQGFLRSITGMIAKLMGGKLWANLAFSRVASWGKEFSVLVSYILKNKLEASGSISYTPRSG
jgi:REP element-mobilizing transposase RayT